MDKAFAAGKTFWKSFRARRAKVCYNGGSEMERKLDNEKDENGQKAARASA